MNKDETIKSQQALIESMGQTNKALVKRLNIWKDPKVELPSENKNLLMKINSFAYKLHTGIFVNNYYSDKAFVHKQETEDYDLKFDIEDVDKWCYEEDLIKQAGK